MIHNRSSSSPAGATGFGDDDDDTIITTSHHHHHTTTTTTSSINNTNTRQTATSSISRSGGGGDGDDGDDEHAPLIIPMLQQPASDHSSSSSSSSISLSSSSSAELQPRSLTPWAYLRSFLRSEPNYQLISFFPVTIFNQFRYFYNLYFLLICLTQFVPIFKVGFTFTYVAPLAFVLALSLSKEAYDDIKRWRTDTKANSQIYQVLSPGGVVEAIPSSKLKVGHLVKLSLNQRVPADMILLKTSEKSGASFIRTDQLDGETDWKLRRSIAFSQNLSDEDLSCFLATVHAEKPQKDIYSFHGNFVSEESTDPLTIDNTLWANTVVASATVVGLVIYTGKETRSSMNRNHPKTKTAITDQEINFLSKILFVLLSILSFVMVALQGFQGLWYISVIRFMILFSSIIPISMRVNLDMAKTLYSIFIMSDKKIPGTIVRNTSLPEELGRISYVLSDKTGTLTQNDMIFKKLHLGNMCFSSEDRDTLREYVVSNVSQKQDPDAKRAMKLKYSLGSKVSTALHALALCHNVTPATNEDGSVTYQASSPDEIALVKFTKETGVTLHDRGFHSIQLKNALEDVEEYTILNVFPFSSANKRMGIILKDMHGEIIFLMKGADVVMSTIVKENDWLDEACGNMAREGLRTLVFGMKRLTEDQYSSFAKRFHDANCSITDHDLNVMNVVASIENSMDLLCVTGVEDKLQNGVRETLEMLKGGGVKVWMLTGDKIETATCIAISARLVSQQQSVFVLSAKDLEECATLLRRFADEENSCLVIDGSSLQMCLDSYRDSFFSAAQRAPSVVCCRCSPTQKAEIVILLKHFTKSRVCAIGDGGNDVSMILAADVGLGIEGKEGKQASMAADFSLTQFNHLSRLLMWHGRLAYKRSSVLAQFVMHRGMIISFIQAIFSSVFFFAAIAIYQGWLLVGYATFYTMAPVFSLALDEDVSEEVVSQYPELYQELHKGRALSLHTFAIWVFMSVYQGCMIMLTSLFLFEEKFVNIVSISFTSLFLTELLNIAFEIRTWNWLMIIAEVVSGLLYFLSMFLLRTTYFDPTFVLTANFVWKVSVITAVSCLPVSLTRFVFRKIRPAGYSKVERVYVPRKRIRSVKHSLGGAMESIGL